MESAKTVILGKSVFLLTGVRSVQRRCGTVTAMDIESHDKLIETARRNPDAVAFGYVSGSWVAAA